MSAVSPRMLEQIPPPALDDYDKAIFENKYDQANSILERIYKKNIPEPIKAETMRVRANISVTIIECGILHRATPKIHLAKNVLEKALRSHDFDVFLELIGQGADPKEQTATGQSLLHVAIEEYYQKLIVEQVLENGVLFSPTPLHVLHILLEMGVDPNQKDANGGTPLAIASKKGDIYAVYLLLAYGAIPDKEIFFDLREATLKRDPLYISAGDSVVFAATCASWLARGILKVTGSNEYIDAAVDAISIAGTVGYLVNREYTLSRVIALGALELIPTTRVYTQLVKTACVAASAFTGLMGVYNNYVNRPWDACKKLAVVTVNSFSSFSGLLDATFTEYAQSQLFKKAIDMGVNIQDIDSQPTWTCDNYQKLFWAASKCSHPDKPGGSTQAQIAIVAARDFMRKVC